MTKESGRTMPTRHPPEGRKRTALGWRAAGPLVVVLVVVAVLLASCGGSPSNGVAGGGSTTTTSPGSGAPSAVAGAVRFANCMRSNRVTKYPDPSSSGRPQSLNQIDPNSPTFQTAYKACQKYASNGVGVRPNPHPPNCASRSRSPSACASTGSRVPGPAHDRISPGDLYAGPRDVFSDQRHLPRDVAGVHACSQGLRSAASLTSPIGEQHASAAALPVLDFHGSKASTSLRKALADAGAGDRNERGFRAVMIPLASSVRVNASTLATARDERRELFAAKVSPMSGDDQKQPGDCEQRT